MPRRSGAPLLGHWRRVQGFVPDRLRVNEHEPPREEWVALGGLDLHLDRYLPAQRAPVRVLVLHGGGANGGLLSPFGVMAQRLGAEAVVPDLPGYGATRVPNKRRLRYQDWVDATVGLLEKETSRDERPVVLLGLSMGGMLAFDAAGRTGRAAAVVASCLLDPQDPRVRRGMARTEWIGAAARPLLGRTARVTDGLPVPMRVVAPVGALARDRALTEAVASDPRGGGTWMPGGWLRTYLDSSPAVPPEQFRVCPLVLAHPAADQWTPVGLSLPFYERIAGPRRIVMLEGASHACVEDPGVAQLERVLAEMLDSASPSF